MPATITLVSVMTSLLHAHRMMQLNSVTRSAEEVRVGGESSRRRGEPSQGSPRWGGEGGGKGLESMPR